MTALLVIRSSVPVYRDYGRYREHLRLDFWFSCAYCTIAELEATGIGFCIDHYEPQDYAPHLSSAYENLMYSCTTCNGSKSNHPSPAHRARGFRFFRPDQDDYTEHFRLNGVRLSPLTDIGRYTHCVLNLDSALLRRVRDLRSRAQFASDAIAVGVRYLKGVPLDRLPPAARSHFVRIRREVGQEVEKAENLVERALLKMSRSPNLDPDPDAKVRAARRREFLRSVGAPDCAVLAPVGG